MCERSLSSTRESAVVLLLWIFVFFAVTHVSAWWMLKREVISFVIRKYRLLVREQVLGDEEENYKVVAVLEVTLCE